MSVLVGLNFPLRFEEVQCSLEKSSPVLGTNFPWLAVLILRYFLGARAVPENIGQLSCIVVFLCKAVSVLHTLKYLRKRVFKRSSHKRLPP